MGNAEDQKHHEEKAVRSSSYLHQGRVLKFRIDTIDYHGKDRPFEIVEHPGAVAILPIANDGKILFVRQWRRASKQILLEIPAGTLEEGEDPKECAQRELQEEVGYLAKSLEPYGGFYTAPGFCSEYIHLFIAKNLVSSPLTGDEDEGIDVEAITLEESLRLAKSGKICDAKTLVAIYKYKASL
jgi:ADP-ribose pyrophosphatase